MVPSGERFALCTTVVVPECIAIDRRDEGDDGGNVVLLLGGHRHGKQGAARDSADADEIWMGAMSTRFIRRVLKACSNTPTVLVDGGLWYSWGLRWMGVPWERVTFEERNAVEQ